MRSVTVSAPGKLMLFGEHAVLHGSACIVTVVDQRIKVTVTLTDTSTFELQAPDIDITSYKKPLSEIGIGDPSASHSTVSSDRIGSGQAIPKGAQFVEIAVDNFLNCHPERAKRVEGSMGIKVATSSEFSSLFGFGSSSAVTVCVIKALSVLFDIKLSDRKLFDLSYKTVLDVQKKGSGFDIAAAIFGGTLYFISGGKVIEPLGVESLSIVVGYSGVKADTVTVINQVEEKTKKEQDVVKNIYANMGKIVDNAKEAIVKKDWVELGKLMNNNQTLLQDLGVSTDTLNSMITASLNSGALGAKLSGAGGGDCMIALCSKEKRNNVADAIEKNGGQVIDVLVNAEGVRVEL